MATQPSSATITFPRPTSRSHKGNKGRDVESNLRIDPRLRAPKAESFASSVNSRTRFETVIDKLAIVAYPVDPKTPANFHSTHCHPSSPSPSLSSTLSTGSSVSDFSVSENDEVIRTLRTPPLNDAAIKCSLHITSPAGTVYAHTIFASPSKANKGRTNLSPTFIGILRTMHADRPYFDPSGPPVWTAEYTALYEVCGTFYSQQFPAVSSFGMHKSRARAESMLFVKRVAWLGELASMSLLHEPFPLPSQSPIGRAQPNSEKSTPNWYAVPVFEESGRYGFTGFEPLEGPRPIYKTPDEIEKCADCFKATFGSRPIAWPTYC